MPLSKKAKKLLMLWWWRRKRRMQQTKRHHKYWIHPIFKQRSTLGEYHHLLNQVLSDENKCMEYLRMKISTFQDLLNLCSAKLQRQTTNYRVPVSARERLVVTLR